MSQVIEQVEGGYFLNYTELLDKLSNDELIELSKMVNQSLVHRLNFNTITT